MVGDRADPVDRRRQELDELDRGKAEPTLAAARELPMLTVAEFEGRQMAYRPGGDAEAVGELIG